MIDIGPYAPLSLAIAARTDLSPTAKLVHAVLVRHQGDNESAWPSATTLGREIGVGERRVREVLRELELAGVVSIEARPGRSPLCRVSCPVREGPDESIRGPVPPPQIDRAAHPGSSPLRTPDRSRRNSGSIPPTERRHNEVRELSQGKTHSSRREKPRSRRQDLVAEIEGLEAVQVARGVDPNLLAAAAAKPMTKTRGGRRVPVAIPIRDWLELVRSDLPWYSPAITNEGLRIFVARPDVRSLGYLRSTLDGLAREESSPRAATRSPGLSGARVPPHRIEATSASAFGLKLAGGQ